jgi:hypothetical protein
MTNGNYDTAPVGISIVDLASGERRHLPDIVWLSGVTRFDSGKIWYVSYVDGTKLVDVQTMEYITIRYDLDVTSFDFHTLARVDSGRNDDGEIVSTLYVYVSQSPDAKTPLLTATYGSIGVWEMTENYIICMLSDGRADTPRQLVIVAH